MIQAKKNSPKLRASAAQARALVPFAVWATGRYFDDGDQVELAAKTAAMRLNECYAALAEDKDGWEEQLLHNSICFAEQYVALEAYHDDAKIWKVKPKLHLFLEICSEGTKPSLIWGYQDEDFGGVFAKFGRRKGGLQSSGPTSNNVLMHFRMLPIVRLMEF